jgi:hypothetical protein
MILQDFKTKKEAVDEFRKIRTLSYQGVSNLEKLTKKERTYLGEPLLEMPSNYLRLVKQGESVGNTVCRDTADNFFDRIDPISYMYRNGILLTLNNIPFGIVKNLDEINLLAGKTFYQKTIMNHALFKLPLIKKDNAQYTFPLVKGLAYSFDTDSEDILYQQFITRKYISNQWTQLEITTLKQPLIVAPLRVVARHDFYKSERFEKFEEFLSKEINTIPLQSPKSQL